MIKLVERVGKHGFFSVVVQKGISAANAVVLVEQSVEEFRHTGMIGEHETGNLVWRFHKGRFASQG
jgi:hypothetical protein